MKTLRMFSLFCVLIAPMASLAQVETFGLTRTNDTKRIEIKTNEVMQVLFHHDVNFKFIVAEVTNSMDPTILDFGTDRSPAKLPIIAGPASLIVGLGFSSSGTGIFTIKRVIQTDTLTPLSTVVIPSDANAQVNVILESSTNLVSWTAALPGTYGKSANTRFFRVRAELLQ